MLTASDPLPSFPERILVAGVSGAGKSTLARRIAGIAQVPYTDLDTLYHGPGWTPRPSFLEDARDLAARDAWVTEWQYRHARPILLDRAELLVWLDLPFWTTNLPRVVRRTLRRRLTREVVCNGNIEAPLHRFLTDREHIVRWAISTRRKYRDAIPPLDADPSALPIVRLRSQREVDRWVDGSLRRAAVGRPADPARER